MDQGKERLSAHTIALEEDRDRSGPVVIRLNHEGR
jgi:hypothetical protein